jgi:hypothetical protein
LPTPWLPRHRRSFLFAVRRDFGRIWTSIFPGKISPNFAMRSGKTFRAKTSDGSAGLRYVFYDLVSAQGCSARRVEVRYLVEKGRVPGSSTNTGSLCNSSIFLCSYATRNFSSVRKIFCRVESYASRFPELLPSSPIPANLEGAPVRMRKKTETRLGGMQRSPACSRATEVTWAESETGLGKQGRILPIFTQGQND